MDVYDELGVRAFINASGAAYTRYGGSIMREEAVAAMAAASRRFVNMYELQERMGEAIARMTRNEGAFVSCGAASGMVLSVAACIAGTDAALAERLPGTEGMRNEVVMPGCARGTEADPAIRAAGGRIVEAGPADRMPAAAVLLGAVTEKTGAIVLLASGREDEREYGAIVAGARERGVAVLIDGACAVPPQENLWRYTREMGADAFITSGGKGIRGPQASGLVVGSRRIIEGCRFHASPNLRIGRGMKVGKEEFAGLYAALKVVMEEDRGAVEAGWRAAAERIAESLRGIGGIRVRVKRDEVRVDFEGAGAGVAEEVAKRLFAGEPAILVMGRGGRVTVRTWLLEAGEEGIVGERVGAELRRAVAEGAGG
ncbi:MAG TPA: hypothetical protein VHQ47_01980 [Phycisphaerae bacterium]|nr:hypothetical protein [Phycisphaerae bacterium]